MKRTIMLQHFFLFLYDLYSDPIRWALSMQDTEFQANSSIPSSINLQEHLFSAGTVDENVELSIN